MAFALFFCFVAVRTHTHTHTLCEQCTRSHHVIFKRHTPAVWLVLLLCLHHLLNNVESKSRCLLYFDVQRFGPKEQRVHVVLMLWLCFDRVLFYNECALHGTGATKSQKLVHHSHQHIFFCARSCPFSFISYVYVLFVFYPLTRDH